MKLATINMIVGTLSGIKLNKITDKRVKTTLVNDYLHLRKFVREAEIDRQALIDKFQSDWADELPKVEAFRQDKKPVVGHDEYLEAERDANKAIQDLFSREVDITITPVSFEAFEGVSDALTLEQAALLQEVGIIRET